MDLSFTSFTRNAEPVGWPGGVVALMRRADGPPAPAHADDAAPAGPLSPTDGCFNGEMAAALSLWRGE